MDDYIDIHTNNNAIPEFDTGAKRSIAGKEDYIESISWLALKRYAEYMDESAKRYGRGNWIKGIPLESYEKSLIRHLQKYICKKYYGIDLEPGVDHEAAILFNIQGLIHEQEKTKYKDGVV